MRSQGEVVGEDHMEEEGGQIMWRREETNRGYRGGGNVVSKGGNQSGP